MQLSDGAVEWSLLQNQFDSYEKFSLLIKIVSVLILVVAVLLDRSGVIMAAILLTLWLQDGIWKTFQSRIEVRLLVLERHLAADVSSAASSCVPYQFNDQYAQNRPGSVDLIFGYLRQAIRPTVAFPHVVLLALLFVHCQFL